MIGSRAEGTATELSDWDFSVEVEDFDSFARDLPSLVAPLDPIAQQWDRLSPFWTYMLMLPGAVKIDLLFLEEPHELGPPWSVGPDTLEPIDRHFWDWFVWLRSKEAAGKTELLREELEKMWVHLLQPMGIQTSPASVDEAEGSYLRARAALEQRFGVEIPRTLEREVLRSWPQSS